MNSNKNKHKKTYDKIKSSFDHYQIVQISFRVSEDEAGKFISEFFCEDSFFYFEGGERGLELLDDYMEEYGKIDILANFNQIGFYICDLLFDTSNYEYYDILHIECLSYMTIYEHEDYEKKIDGTCNGIEINNDFDLPF